MVKTCFATTGEGLDLLRTMRVVGDVGDNVAPCVFGETYFGEIIESTFDTVAEAEAFQSALSENVDSDYWAWGPDMSYRA